MTHTASPPIAHPRRQRRRRLSAALLLAAAVLSVAGLTIGSEGLDALSDLWRDEDMRQIAWDVRLPRTLGALLAGALLGLAGSVAQGLFRNPLADPYLLGSSSGAALGVALALLLGPAAMSGAGALAALPLLAGIGLTGAAFVGSLAAVLLTLTLARGVGGNLRLLLAGVVVGVVLGAAKNTIEMTHPDILQATQAYVLGTTAMVGWQSCAIMALALLVCALAAWSLSRVLDGLALGEATARSLGLPLGALQMALVGVMALATAAAVAQTGLLAFVGLAAPHLVRAIVQVRHAQLVLLSAMMGAVLLGAADLLARGLIAPQEIPVGVLTALLGGGYLLWLMHRQRSMASG